jgi:hypothetical protein
MFVQHSIGRQIKSGELAKKKTAKHPYLPAVGQLVNITGQYVVLLLVTGQHPLYINVVLTRPVTGAPTTCRESQRLLLQGVGARPACRRP